jgi:hypothetical protein
MGKGNIARYYKTMSPEDQRTYNRWLKGNAIAGSILAVGLIAMALAGSNSAPSPSVANIKNPDVVASKQRHE